MPTEIKLEIYDMSLRLLHPLETNMREAEKEISAHVNNGWRIVSTDWNSSYFKYLVMFQKDS
ncbi:MAG: hypothetical protein H7Y17_00595 [Chlorobia bacterium]|nr:hypothetical protein [Fimbriimonadaceae bacterium]